MGAGDTKSGWGRQEHREGWADTRASGSVVVFARCWQLQLEHGMWHHRSQESRVNLKWTVGIPEWLGLEGTLKIIVFQAGQSSPRPWELQGWGTHSLCAQPGPVPHHPQCKTAASLDPASISLLQLKATPLVLSPEALLNTLSPSFLWDPSSLAQPQWGLPSVSSFQAEHLQPHLDSSQSDQGESRLKGSK